MFCQKCGFNNKDDAHFCCSCGLELVPLTVTESTVEKDAVSSATGDGQDVKWMDKPTEEKIFDIVNYGCVILLAHHLYGSFGYCFDWDELIYSVLGFIHCLFLAGALLSFPLWVFEIIARKVLNKPKPMEKGIIILMNVISNIVLGIVSFIAVLSPYYGVGLIVGYCIIFGIIGWIMRKTSK